MITLRSAALVAAGVVAAVAATAFAGSTETKVAGVGKAELRWNDVRYRKELLDQLSPGLVWRMGSGGPTRIAIDGMSLVGETGILFPGEATLNLRHFSVEKWELIAFEEEVYAWTADKHTFATAPCPGWREKDPKKSAEKLALTLRAVTGKTRTQRPADVATTGDGAKPAPSATDAPAFSKEAQAEADKAPWVEIEMRLGDLVGLTSLEAAETGELKGRHGEAKTPFVLRWPRYRDPRAKSETLAAGREVVLGVVKDEGPSPAELLVVVRGGDDPSIDLRKVGTSESVRRLTGRRDAVKAPPKGLDWTFDGTSLVLTAHGATYTFAF